MIDGSLGSNSTGDFHPRRWEVVAEVKFWTVSPPFTERLQLPFCEQAYTRFWSTGLISVSRPSPQAKPSQPPSGFPYERLQPLSWAPPTMRLGSCSPTSSV